jgi:hypothetical protein
MEFTRISYKFSNDKVNQSLSRPDYHIILRNRYRSRTVGTDRPAGKQYREMMIVFLIALLVLQFSRCSMFYCFRSLTFCTWFILYPICQKNGGGRILCCLVLYTPSGGAMLTFWRCGECTNT